MMVRGVCDGGGGGNDSLRFVEDSEKGVALRLSFCIYYRVSFPQTLEHFSPDHLGSSNQVRSGDPTS